MAVTFCKASKHQSKLRMALIGPSGSGKTYTSLAIASHLGTRVAMIDTEHGSASKYADLFDFDVVELSSFHPQVYIEAIQAAEDSGYEVLIIDSLSHAWAGKDGALELKDKAATRSKSNDSFGAWREITPLHNRLVDAIVGAKLHIICTMRSKVEYVVDRDEKGRTQIRKVGLQPVQRDGVEYEFDVVGDLDHENTLVVTKTRCPLLVGSVLQRASKEVADTLRGWLESGVPDDTANESSITSFSAADSAVGSTSEDASQHRPTRHLKTSQAQEERGQAITVRRPATQAQLSLLNRLFREAGELDRHQEALLMEHRFGPGVVSRRDLTVQQASELITWLRSGGVGQIAAVVCSGADNDRSALTA